MKFDYIVGNPPYLKGTHVKVCNQSVSMLAPNGTMKMIHPCSILLKNPNIERDQFKSYLEMYQSNVEIIKNPFNIYISSWLNITTVTKKSGVFTFKYDKEPFTGSHKDVNTLQIEPVVYRRIWNAYSRYIQEHRSLKSIRVTGTEGNAISKIAAEPKFTEQTNKNSKIFTTKKITSTKTEWRIPGKYAYQYMNSIPARLGLMLMKHDQNVNLSMVPLVPLDRTYTEHELFEMFGITPEDQKVIYDVFSKMKDTNLIITLD